MGVDKPIDIQGKKKRIENGEWKIEKLQTNYPMEGDKTMYKRNSVSKIRTNEHKG